MPAALAGLSEIYREVIVLREFEDMSHQEIAEVTQLPRACRARREICARRSRKTVKAMSATNCDDISDLLEPFTDGELAIRP